MEDSHGNEHLSLWELYQGNLEGGAPLLGNLMGGTFTGDFERWTKEGSRDM